MLASIGTLTAATYLQVTDAHASDFSGSPNVGKHCQILIYNTHVALGRKTIDHIVYICI